MSRITEDMKFGGSGVVTVSATAAAMATTVNAKAVLFQAPGDNSGTAYIGGPTVTSSNGYLLSAGNETGILPGKPGDYYVIGTQSDEIRYLYWI